MSSGFELLDHTADVGVRAWADSLAGLITPATAGLYEILGELALVGGPPEEHRIELAGDESALLLRDYLAELLHLFETRQQRFEVVHVDAFTERELVVSGHLRSIDMPASNLEREIKAVTYHHLEIRRNDAGLEVTYIVDI